MTQIVINIPSELATALRKAAVDRGIPPSVLVTQALGVYLQEPAPTVPGPVVASDPLPNVPTALPKRPSARALPRGA